MMSLPFLDTEGRIVVPPPRRRLLREVRAVLLPRPRLFRHPLLRQAPHGDGHPVFVLPGFLTNDGRTRHLRRLLATLGYETYGWGEGVNWGPTDYAIAAIERRLREIRRRHERKVTLIGHSLGGMLARELAKKFPDDVRAVVMLGSPVRLPTATSLAVLFRLLARFHRTAQVIAQGLQPATDRTPTEEELRSSLADVLSSGIALSEGEYVSGSVTMAVPIFREDGIVAWETCLEQSGDMRENIEVTGTHSTLPSNPRALAIVADRLAQPEGAWRAYVVPPAIMPAMPTKPRVRFRRRRMSA